MPGGVKHRLSNVIAWAGFAAAIVTLPCAVLWGVWVLQPYKAEQESIGAGRAERDRILKSLSATEKVPDNALEEARRLSEALEREYTVQDAESERRLRRGNDNALVAGASSAVVWLLLGVVNYILFGAFRASPWKQGTDGDQTTTRHSAALQRDGNWPCPILDAAVKR